MSDKPLVSAVIICFNDEEFLQEAISSVICQTYDNWELLLVDDGSTDDSPRIMQKYVEKYPQKIRYLEHENHRNRGKNASRNLGINHAQGDYIATLDSDDIWLPEKLEQQVEILNQYPQAGMVYGRLYEWYSWTGKPEDRQRDGFSRFPLGVESNKLIQPPTLLPLLIEGTTQTPTTCSPMFRREVFEQVGLFDDNFRDIFEDIDFFAKVLLQVSVFVSDRLWAKYRQNPASSMGNYDSAVERDIRIWYCKRLRFLKSVKNYVCQQKNEYPEIQEYLNERISNFQRKLWLSRLPVISNIHISWMRSLGLAMQVGRRILPFGLRDWLWKRIGARLYN